MNVGVYCTPAYAQRQRAENEVSVGEEKARIQEEAAGESRVCVYPLGAMSFGDLSSELLKLDPIGLSNAAKGIYAALATIDPAGAVALYEKFPDDLPYNTKNSVARRTGEHPIEARPGPSASYRRPFADAAAVA